MRPWLLALCLTSLVWGCSTAQPRARSGAVTLVPADFDDPASEVSLSGEWEFFPGTLGTEGTPQALVVPGAWDGAMTGHLGTGVGTYRLVVRVPRGGSKGVPWGLRIQKAGTAYRVLVDGRLVYECGTVGPEGLSRPHYETALVPLGALGDGPLDLQIEVSNFHDRNGGLWNPVTLGPWDQLSRSTQASWARELFLAGAFGALALYHLVLFLMRTKATEYLHFVAINAALAVYCLVFLSCSLEVLVPGLPWEMVFKLEYAAIVVAMGAAVGYLGRLFDDIPSLVVKGALGLLWAYLAFLVVSPPLVVSRAVFLVYGLLVGYLVVLVGGLARALVHRREDSAILLAAVLLLGTSVVSDIVLVAFNVPHEGLSPWGALAAMAAQAYLLSVRFWRNDRSVVALTQALEVQNQALGEANAAFARFVPMQFLAHLGRDSRDLRLGDHVARPMVVMFLGLRGTEVLRQALSVQDFFQFLNRFHEVVGRVIRSRGGFVDKYMAHRVMALFDGEVDQAFGAALDLREALVVFNRHQEDRGQPPVAVGMGIHHGQLSLGIIGEEGRMETTVIADAVNLTARIEGLAGPGGILTTRSTVDLMAPGTLCCRPIGTTMVKGKRREVDLVEVLSAPAP